METDREEADFGAAADADADVADADVADADVREL